jgi:hypothetical protein
VVAVEAAEMLAGGPEVAYWGFLPQPPQKRILVTALPRDLLFLLGRDEQLRRIRAFARIRSRTLANVGD